MEFRDQQRRGEGNTRNGHTHQIPSAVSQEHGFGRRPPGVEAAHNSDEEDTVFSRTFHSQVSPNVSQTMPTVRQLLEGQGESLETNDVGFAESRLHDVIFPQHSPYLYTPTIINQTHSPTFRPHEPGSDLERGLPDPSILTDPSAAVYGNLNNGSDAPPSTTLAPRRHSQPMMPPPESSPLQSRTRRRRRVLRWLRRRFRHQMPWSSRSRYSDSSARQAIRDVERLGLD
ncbi:hypothetical protein MMC12_006818 [Toensbergia leucococca]|nr:hypothetical protein [Toensbergia leucococca]